MINLIETKVLVAVLFGLIRFAFGILPIQICAWLQPTKQNRDKNQPPLQDHPLLKNGLILAQCFSGGVFFATCFLHMMPEVYRSVSELKHIGILNSHYPYSQLIISLGFFLIYFLEEFCHWLITITPKTPFKCKRICRMDKNLNGPLETPPEETVNLKSQENEKEGLEDLESTDESENTSLDSEELDNILEEEKVTNQHVLRCTLILAALSIHSIFEGIAVGLQHSVTNIWYVFTAISIHSAVVLFYIGLLTFLRRRRVKTIILRMLLLSINSPLGVFIGIVISVTVNTSSDASSLAAVVLEGISAGAILYITFIEILGKEKERRVFRRTRTLTIGAGFVLMAGLVCIT